jgi:hypothetical protein
MSIQNSSMLVELNISVWTASVSDKDISAKVAADNNATADAGQYKKNLMAGTSARKDIADFAAACRTWHNTRTLPWSDRGPRLLPSSLFLDYKSEANTRRDKFHEMVDDFVKNYATHVTQAQAHSGALFNPADYPSADEVHSKFGFRMVFSPVPLSGDFRIDAPNQELQELVEQYEASMHERVVEATKSVWDKLHTMLTGMTDKLALTEKTRWHNSFVTNAQEMCQMLTHLNVANDPKLEAARKALEVAMLGADIDDIKDSEYVRADMKDKLDGILKAYTW